MNQLFKFSSYNSQALYGWGTESEAADYCDYLNRHRDINVYTFDEITDQEQIDKMGAYKGGEDFNLLDALVEIANNDT